MELPGNSLRKSLVGEVGYLKRMGISFSFTFCDSVPFFCHPLQLIQKALESLSRADNVPALLSPGDSVECYITCHTSFVRDRYFWDLQPGKFEHGWNPGNPFNLYTYSYLCLKRLSSDPPGKVPSVIICWGERKPQTIMHTCRQAKTEVNAWSFTGFPVW